MKMRMFKVPGTKRGFFKGLKTISLIIMILSGMYVVLNLPSAYVQITSETLMMACVTTISAMLTIITTLAIKRK